MKLLLAFYHIPISKKLSGVGEISLTLPPTCGMWGLTFQSAIYLRSLTPEQICQYLDNIQADLTGLKALIEGDTALQELAKSPLMLSIMVLAYEGVAAEDLPNTDVVEERRKQLFDAYITRMFHRPTRLKVEQRYSEAQSIRWLTWLAQRMVQESQTVFLIEGMQPTWLPTNYTKYKKIFYRLAIFFIAGLIYGVINGLFAGLIYGWIIGLIPAWGNPEIKTVETLKWSWEEAKNSLISAVIIGLITGLITGLFTGLINSLMIGLINGLVGGLFSVFFFGLFFGLILGLVGGLVGGMKGSVIATKTIPNQGIYRTAMNAGIMGLMIGLFSGLMIGLFSGLINGLNFGLNFGLIAVIVGGGKACIQHLTLRLILYRNGCIPWNYARFLDYAAERIFLQKVGGGYIFIHRLLLEHFAQMKLGK